MSSPDDLFLLILIFPIVKFSPKEFHFFLLELPLERGEI
jgi:hypothetical protein